MRSFPAAVGLTFALCGFVAAQSVTVQFADGLLQAQRGSGWTVLETGSDVAADAVVRLADGGYAELARGDRTITLSRGGTYRLSDLLRTAGAAASWGMGTVVNARLAALSSGVRTVEAQAAQMGVRGSAQGSAAITWVDDEAAELVRRGVTLLAEGKPREALGSFLQAVESATDRESEAAAKFYAAYAHDQLGERAQAIRLVSRIAPAPAAEYYRDFVLLKSRLLIESAAPAEGLALLDGFLASGPTGEGAQAAQILAAFACRALRDRSAAVGRLERARDAAPDSEFGRRARALIPEMR